MGSRAGPPLELLPGFARAQFGASSEAMRSMTWIVRATKSVPHGRPVRIAARFFDRSIDTRTFKRGIDAYNNPSFYRQAGKEPNYKQLITAALELLAKRFRPQ